MWNNKRGHLKTSAIQMVNNTKQTENKRQVSYNLITIEATLSSQKRLFSTSFQFVLYCLPLELHLYSRILYCYSTLILYSNWRLKIRGFCQYKRFVIAVLPVFFWWSFTGLALSYLSAHETMEQPQR